MAVPVNVPRAPGVPNVLFADGVSSLLQFLTEDAVGIFRGANRGQQWGIFSGGSPVVVADNVIAFEYRQQWSIADFPVERGAFQSFNKVQIPFDGGFRFSAGGSEANRQAFLNSIAAIAGTLTLYNIVTPEAVYLNVNVTRYNYNRRADSGLGLMQVDISTLEVREVAAGAMSNTVDPTSQSQVNGGVVQTTTATTTQTALTNHIAGGHATE